MSTLTIRMPDDKHQRLKQLAESKGISVNKLIEELSTIALTEFDTYNRFKLRAASGDAEEGLRCLEELDKFYATGE
jgi:predicted transcriptional regulator